MFNRIREEQGFTLIELLVVILIIGILIAVAAPSFLGQQDKAKNSGMQQDLTVLYKGAKAAATSNSGDYPATATLVPLLKESEPQLEARVSAAPAPPADPAPTTEGNITVQVTGSGTSDVLTLRGLSGSGDLITLTSTNGGAPDFTP